MSMLFVDSFDHYGTADIQLKWDDMVAATTMIAATSGRRSGTGALALVDGWVKKNLPGSPPTVITGMACKLVGLSLSDGSGAVVTFGNADGAHLRICPQRDGSLSVQRRTSVNAYTQIGYTTAAAFPLNVYFYIEAKVVISPTVGQVKILVNGASVLNLTNVNTVGFNSTNATAGYVQVAGAYSTFGQSALIDDLYICDGRGTINNDFLGDVRVDVIRPSADGTYGDFIPDTGTVHYSRINEMVADSVSSIASATVGAKDSYAFDDLAAVAGTIRGVQICNAALKDDAGFRSIANLTKSGASEVQSDAMPLSTDRKLYASVQEIDPATGVLWTLTGVNGAQFGIVVTG